VPRDTGSDVNAASRRIRCHHHHHHHHHHQVFKNKLQTQQYLQSRGINRKVSAVNIN